jgi:hypothetical protein
VSTMTFGSKLEEILMRFQEKGITVLRRISSISTIDVRGSEAFRQYRRNTSGVHNCE